MSHLPSIQTLRAFEAAGRLKSYSKAAEELGLTHGAVSHRIRELEQRLGKTLFNRVGNSMVLTDAGAQLMARVRQGLSLLEQAFAPPKAEASKAPSKLQITSVPSIAGTWLLARLSEFRELHPNIDVSVRVAEGLATFKNDGNDVGIRLGTGGWPGLNAVKLFEEVLSPACTPDYRDRMQLAKPEDLQRATLLRNPWTPWTRWFKAADLDWPEPSSGPSFDDATLLLRAAMQGTGVALARHWLAIEEVRAGRLVYPFEHVIWDDFSYWLVWPEKRGENPAVPLFRDFILGQAAKERAAH